MTPIRRHLTTAFAAAGLVLALLGSAAPVLAATGNIQTSPVGNITIEEPIPQSALEKGVSNAAATSVKGVADYISRIYNFAIASVGLVAAVMMIIGGFQYLTSAGDAGKVGAAKKRITDAIIGLVLALGSFVLLKSLNPELVNMHPLTVEKNTVAAKILVLPWCEVLMKQGIKVTKVSDDTSACGAVGSYMTGKTENACIYFGSCGVNVYDTSFNGRTAIVVNTSSEAHVLKTCMPYVSAKDANGKETELTSDLALQIAKQDTSASSMALCMPCAVDDSIYVTKLGYPDVVTGCNIWNGNMKARLLESQGSGGQYWSSCTLSSRTPKGCEQTDIDCQAVENNSDNNSNSQCSDKNNDCACEGYDDSPETYVTDTDGKQYLVKNLDDLKDHLRQVCAANPCADYKNKETNKQNFLSGCLMKTSTDCRNVGRPALPAPDTADYSGF